MSDHASLNALLARVQELSRQSLRPLGGRLVGDAQETMLDNYRSIARLAAAALEALRGPDGEVSDAAVQAAQYVLQIARLCVEEHTRICREEDARRERARRWAEVHDEFEAAQREGRPMRSNWSWERWGYSDWQGEVP
jgi:hypothetical protein